MLDRYAYAELQIQRDARGRTEDVPLRWHEFVDRMSLDLTGHPAQKFDIHTYTAQRGGVLAWHFSPEALAAASFGRRLTFLSWGLSHFTGLRSIVARFVLRRAAHVVANEHVSAEEVELLRDEKVNIVPFFIDTTYFTYAPPSLRSSFAFCPGSNDRDPELLLDLARRGHEICWLVNDRGLIDKYKNADKNLRLVSGISFAELRRLYQTCAACIVPTRRDAHAAGQTTGLEAVACGAPLLISTGRTAIIFQDLPSFEAVDSNTPEAWTSALTERLSMISSGSDTMNSAKQISARLNYPGVVAALSKHLCLDLV